MTKLKNLKKYSISLILLNSNNIYCGCLCNDNNKPTTSNKVIIDEKDKNKPTPEEIEKNRQNLVNNLMYLFNDKKTKLEKAGRLNELKIKEDQIKTVQNNNDAQNIINELNKIKIHNDPVKDVVLDINNISDVPYILKKNNNDPLKTINFIKYVNDDIAEKTNEENIKIMEKLIQENKLFDIIKYNESMFDKDKNKRDEYIKNNSYFLYIDKNTFSLKDYINLGDFTNEKLQLEFVKDNKIFENCYFLFSKSNKTNEIVTVFKKKTIIDLEHLEKYPNIYQTIDMEAPDKAEKRIKVFIKNLYNIEVKTNEEINNYTKESIPVKLANKPLFAIFKCSIDEIEFISYKKSTEEPENYNTIDETEKFEIDIKDSKGTIKYYFVKEKAK